MARLKSVVSEEATEQTKEIEVETVVAQPAKKAAVKETISTTTENTVIPEYVDAILKKYPSYAKLAVDAQGGVYTEGSQPLSNSAAILYQNPYYKQ